jgi:outer membrane protein assembly factor BamB
VKGRGFVFALVLAVGLAVPTPTRAATGTLGPPIWTTDVRCCPWGLAVDGHGAVVTIQERSVVALDLQGHSRWETDVEGVQWGKPAMDASLVLVGATRRVVALARADGTPRWQQPMDTRVTSVALAGSFALVGDQNGTLRAFDAATGAVRWSVHYDGDIVTAAQVDAATSTVVVVWTEPPAPAARALDLATGTVRWEQALGLYSAAPALGDGRVFLGTGDGHYDAWIAALDLASGAGTWWLASPASFQSGIVPAVDGRDLVVVDQLGRVTSIDPASGKPRWTQDLNRRVLDTEVVLLPRRVVVTTLSRELFVLDRVSGRVLRQVAAEGIGAFPYAVARVGPGGRVIVAYRLTEPGRVEMVRVR